MSDSKKLPIALQLYSIRHACAEDLPATLQAVAGMGYDGVEFAGYHGYDAKELRKMLDGLGLKTAGTHTGLDTLLGDELKRTVEFNRELGNAFLIAPGLPAERTDSRQAWKETAKLLDEIAARVADDGFFVGCHNHAAEFEDFDGQFGWDVLYSNSARITMQMDAGNALRAGVEPVEFMKKYPHRSPTVHLKEYSLADGWVPIGEGDVNWKGVFDFCETEGDTRWYIVEFENEDYDVMQAVESCLQALRGMGK